TLDLWIDEPNLETEAIPLTENIVLKISEEGKAIGLEIISFSNLSNEDIEAIPQELRNALMEVMKKLTSKVLKIR
ncbi:MAG: hypothetical protein C0200_06085, partial [Thermoproteota archaeon]